MYSVYQCTADGQWKRIATTGSYNDASRICGDAEDNWPADAFYGATFWRDSDGRLGGRDGVTLVDQGRDESAGSVLTGRESD